MYINHHPSLELLTAYSAASLPLSEAICISAHAEMCSKCYANIVRMNNVGAHLFDHLQPTKISDKLRADVFSQLKSQSNSPIDNKPKKNPKVSNVPRCLQQFIPDSYDRLTWSFITPSIRQAILSRESNGTQVALIKIKAGANAGKHTHMGEEITMVLKGAFSDENGLYQTGDFIIRNSNDQHTPTATKNDECICLTVLDAPIQFTGLLTRWANPLLRWH